MKNRKNILKEAGILIILTALIFFSYPVAAGEVIFHQGTYPPGSALFLTSASNMAYLVQDDFWGLTDEITDVHWWGRVNHFTGSGWEAGNPVGMKFNIAFYQDSSGSPGTLVASFVDVEPTYRDTGLNYGGYNLIIFETSISSPVSLTNGWISIQSTYSPSDSSFLWACSPDNTPNALQNSITMGYGVAFNLTTGCVSEKMYVVEMLKDINPGAGGSYPYWKIIHNSNMIFGAMDGIHGMELWITDGTASGTALLKDINPGVASSDPDGYRFMEYDNKIFFGAYDGTHGGELWVTDGTTAGTTLVKDINPGAGNSDLEGYVFLAYDTKLFFCANDSTHGFELWVTDGTAAGTTLVKDINPGASSSYPFYMIELNDKVYFGADDGTHGRELWVSDGTAAGTIMLIDFNPGVSHSDPIRFIELNDKLLFTADDGAHGRELCMTDGTAAGTTLVKDINLGLGSSHSDPSNFFVFDNKLYCRATDGINGYELWVSDGTEIGTFMLKDIYPTGDSYPQSFVEFDSRLFFNAISASGQELWVTDGTTAGTQLFKDIIAGPGSSAPFSFLVFNNKLFFSANDATHGRELWMSDGTEPGTTQLMDINPGSDSSNPNQFDIYDNQVFFGANDSTHGPELWKLEILGSPCIGGHMLNDCDGEGLAGWTINLYNAAKDKIATTTTNATGRYQFCDLTPGEYTVCEEVKTGWTNITATCIDVVLTCENSLDNDFRNTPLLCIKGRNINDCNGSGLAGWTINLYNETQSKIATTTTNATGGYLFCGLVPGEYTVCEEVKDGWMNVSDPCIDIVLTCDDSMGNDFGNQKLMCISGYLLDYFTNEGLPGWEINLTRFDGGYQASTMTNATGFYEFCDLMHATYIIEVTEQQGYTPLEPIEVMVVCEDSTGNNFVIQESLFCIEGYKINYCTGEGLEGWTITLKDDAETVIATTTTDTSGKYQFCDLLSGTYTVCETMKDGWTNISQTCITVILTCDDYINVNFTNRELFSVNVIKFYDANANGIKDTGEPELTGWKYHIDGSDYFTPDDAVVCPGTYTVTEYMPMQTCWKNTTPTSVEVTVDESCHTVTVLFGNLCLGPGGGKTIGFWGNKNGQALINDADLVMLRALNLKDKQGNDFNPTTKTQLKTWLRGASASNMAYMLSAQLAAMKLNVETLPDDTAVDPDALIYAPGTMSANTLGYATVGDIMLEANAALAADGYTPKGDPNRAYQERLKNALDNANNNKTFVQQDPCAFSFA